MNIDLLSGRARKFIRSSHYRYGDNTSFRVYLDQKRRAALPGRHDPKTYLDNLGIGAFTGKVAVICPANGGIMSELILRGADEVHGYEPRHVFTKGLAGALELIEDDYTATTHNRWPNEGENEKKFDLIIWPEYFEASIVPGDIFQRVFNMLVPDGSLVMEVVHGKSTKIDPGKINMWTPTPEAFTSFVGTKAPYSVMTKAGEGRLDRRHIYTIRRFQPDDIIVVVDEEKAPVDDEPKPKPKKSSKRKAPKSKKEAMKRIAELRRKKAQREVATPD